MTTTMRCRSRTAPLALFALLALAAPSAAQTCPGDCDGNGTVAIAELIRAVSIALGRTGIDACRAADRNGDGAISIGELIAAVNAALSGCQVPAPTPTGEPAATATPGGAATPTAPPTPPASPTATAAAATPTPGVPSGIFLHPESLFQHVVSPADFVSVSLALSVDQGADASATVSLAGPAGTVQIPTSGEGQCSGRPCTRFLAASPQAGLSYQAGADYTLTIQTSIGTATLDFTSVGGIEITADGSQVSWQYDGDSERILVFSPTQTAAFDSGYADRTAPFAIPVSAFGAGPGTYRAAGEVRRTLTGFAVAAPGSSLLLTDSLYVPVVPSMLGLTHTPTLTRTPTATPTRTPTATPTATITGTIPPTPVLTGEILFSSTREGGQHVCVMDADGENVVQITDAAGADRDPQWNSDKSLIAFTRDARLYLMNADGSDARPLRNADFQFTPTFSPDGATIVFAESFSFRTNLFAYDLATEQVTQLTNGPWNDSSPTFTPDGQHIYFASSRDSGFNEIYRMRADGSEVERITTNSNFEQLGEVSPDGTRLAFAARASFGTRSLAVFVMDLGDLSVDQLTSTLDFSDEERPLWSPDGSYLAYRPFLDGTEKVYRMQADGLYMTDLSRNDASEVAGDWK